MKTLVITGGTDGMGRALALTYLQRGDTVIVVGRNREKWRALKAAAAGLGSGERAQFIEADLGRLADAKKAIALIKAKYFALDAIVLCARHYSSARVVSEEGFECNFATFYLSRFLFSHELLGPLENAPQPIIMNVAGPGAPSGRIHWDDFGLANDYSGDEALEQGGKLCDSLGVAFAEVHANVKTRYVLLHPGLVSTNFSGTYDQAVAAQIVEMKKIGKPIELAIQPILAHIDNPPVAPLTAIMDGKPLSLDDAAFSKQDARRLYEATQKTLGRH